MKGRDESVVYRIFLWVESMEHMNWDGDYIKMAEDNIK
jgi:hypothetical protein